MHTEGIAMDLDAIIAEEELAAQGPLAGNCCLGGASQMMCSLATQQCLASEVRRSQQAKRPF